MGGRLRSATWILILATLQATCDSLLVVLVHGELHCSIKTSSLCGMSRGLCVSEILRHAAAIQHLHLSPLRHSTF